MKTPRWRRTVLLLTSNLLLSVLIGFFVYQWIFKQSIEELSTEHSALINSVNTAFSQEMGDITNIVRLANQHLTDVLENSPQDVDKGALLLRIGQVLNNVSQIRWIDTNGFEQVRVNFSNNGGEIVSDDKLQDKSSRYYFVQASTTAPGMVSLSAIDLNIDNGRLTIPYQPTIRVSLHTFSTHPLGEGFLVINFDMTRLFSQLLDLEQVQTRLLLAEGNLQWMIHPDKDQEWRTSRNGEPSNFELSQPSLFRQLLSRQTMSLEKGNDGAIYSGTVLQLRMKHTQSSEDLFILARTSSEFYSLLVKNAVLPAALSAFFTFIFVSLLIIRDVRYQQHIRQLNHALLKERNDLRLSLERQTKLRDELVESEKMASLGMLVAGVAHELSTPVGGTTMCISTLENKLDRLEQKIISGLTRTELDQYLASTKESLAISRHNLARITELIKRFKRLAVDRGSESPTKFSLNQIVADLISTLEAQAESRRVTITTEIQGQIELLSYPGLFSQLLQNLITNAISHAFANISRGEILISASQKGDNVELRVKDNGCGIDKEVQETLFDPFVTTARHAGNTGLGMHLVHQWVTNLLNGRIMFTTAENEGTEFVMTFPVSVIEPGQPMPEDI